MTIIFLSNYYNHHQAPLSEAFYRLTDGNYFFIQTMPLEEERQKLGWGENLPSFVLESYKDKITYQKCIDLINNADVVIVGSAPEKMIRKRIRSGKLVFRYSERIYKKKKMLWQLPLRFIKYHYDNFPYKNVYLLCASAYAARDYAITGMFKQKTFKWGYFPAVKQYEDINNLIQQKKPASLLWVGRLIGWKHPEVPILVAERLKRAGIQFVLNFIGIGVLQDKIAKMISEKGLSDCVHMLGAMKPEEVRKYMEQSEIFLFTSDRNEGWGAVLNESMNSACAVVASRAIGSVPYLIEDGKNGLIYKDGNIEDLYNKVKFLLNSQKNCAELGMNAYRTLSETWNAKVAAKRFIGLVDDIFKEKSNKDIAEFDICSRAENLKSKMSKKGTETK